MFSIHYTTKLIMYSFQYAFNHIMQGFYLGVTWYQGAHCVWPAGNITEDSDRCHDHIYIYIYIYIYTWGIRCDDATVILTQSHVTHAE